MHTDYSWQQGCDDDNLYKKIISERDAICWQFWGWSSCRAHQFWGLHACRRSSVMQGMPHSALAGTWVVTHLSLIWDEKKNKNKWTQTCRLTKRCRLDQHLSISQLFQSGRSCYKLKLHVVMDSWHAFMTNYCLKHNCVVLTQKGPTNVS
jgi:hypothetical protein